MALSTTQYGYIIDPMVPFTDGKGKTIKDGFVRVFVAGSSTPVITYRNFDGAANQDLIELDNSGRTKTSVIGSKGFTYKVCVYDKHHSQESPILTVDKVSVIGANITAGTGATLVTGLDGLTTKPDGFVDASVVGTDGYVALDHTLVTDDLDTDAKVTAVENDRYIPLLNEDVNDPDSKMTLGRMWQWVLGKIKSLSTTITSFRSGDYIAVDGPSGTAKMSKDSLLQETAEYVHTDEIKNNIERNDRVIYRVIENFTDNLNSGYIDVQNGSVSIGASVNYGYAVYDVDEVAIVSTVAGLEGSSSVAAVAYFSDNTISTESFLGCEFGDEYVQEYIGAFNHAIFPPEGTKKVVVTIRLANNDSTRGVYKYDKPARLEIVNKMNFSSFDKMTRGSCNWKNSAITFGTSSNWAYCEIDNLNDLYAVRTAAGMVGADAPAVLFFSSTEKSTATFISCIYADKLISGQVGYLDAEIAIPSNAVSAIVNIRVSEMDGSLGFYSTGKKEDIIRRTLVSDGTGRYRIDGGVISYETHNSWSFAAVKVDKIRKVRVLAGSNGGAVPAVMFFSDKDFTTDTYLGCLYGDVDSSGGAYYTGSIIVPAGAVWAVLNYYNAQVDYYVDLVNGGTKNEIIVAQDGSGNFETIKEAVDVSDKDVVIKVMPGVYEEEIDCFERDINIIGLDKQSCIWVCKKGTYANPPLEASVGHLENITLYSKYEYGESAEIGTVTGAYACHVESARSSATFAHGKSLTFKNCILKSDFAPAIGMGALNGWSFRLEDCELINGQVTGRGSYLADGSIGAMYIHDQNYTEIKEKANITIKNCIFRNLNFNNALALKNNGLTDGRGIDIAFVDNILCSPAGKTSGNLWWRTADHFENGWSNSPISFGNSNSALDS